MQVAVILFLESLGGGELLVILLFVLLFFGSKSIPGLARGLGKGMRELKDAMNGVQNEIRQTMDEPIQEWKESTRVIEKSTDQKSEAKPKASDT